MWGVRVWGCEGVSMRVGVMKCEGVRVWTLLGDNVAKCVIAQETRLGSGDGLPSSGKLLRKKFSRISRFCTYSRKSSPRNWGAWLLSAAQLMTPVSNPRKFSPWKSYLPPIRKKFSPSKVSRYMVVSSCFYNQLRSSHYEAERDRVVKTTEAVQVGRLSKLETGWRMR